MRIGRRERKTRSGGGDRDGSQKPDFGWKRWKLTMDWFLISEIAIIGLIAACVVRALFYAAFGRR